MKKIGIITSGGDCGGLNAVIKGAGMAANKKGISCYVIPNGYAGLYNLVEFDELVELTRERISNFDSGLAGSEAGHSRVKISKIDDINKYERIKEGLKRFDLDGLLISGGDDTGSVIVDLTNNGIKCVHAPKTMDLDLQTYSVGADSTISRIADFARDLRTTGRTHNRIIVMEVFGRDAGHTAFRGGVGAEADAILIPEINVDFEVVYQDIKEKFFSRIASSDVRAGTYLIVVAEGVRDFEGKRITNKSAGVDAFGHKKLEGAAKFVSKELSRIMKEDDDIPEKMKEFGMFIDGLYHRPEVRSVAPGHLVRCGQSSAFDVNFGVEAGAAAIKLLSEGIFGVTVAEVRGSTITYMKTADAIKQRHVDLDQVAFHESLGTCFGRKAKESELVFTELEKPPHRFL